MSGRPPPVRQRDTRPGRCGFREASHGRDSGGFRSSPPETYPRELPCCRRKVPVFRRFPLHILHFPGRGACMGSFSRHGQCFSAGLLPCIGSLPGMRASSPAGQVGFRPCQVNFRPHLVHFPPHRIPPWGILVFCLPQKQISHPFFCPLGCIPRI